jgi:hypothetical protein
VCRAKLTLGTRREAFGGLGCVVERLANDNLVRSVVVQVDDDAGLPAGHGCDNGKEKAIDHCHRRRPTRY